MTAGKPLHLLDARVEAGWLDYNGHMNDGWYAIVFSRALDALMDRVGLDAASRRASQHTLYTLTSLIHFRKEAHLDASLSIDGRLLEHDAKRMRVWLDMRLGPDGPLLATSEQLLLSIDQSQDTPRAAPWRDETRAALDALARAHASIPVPAEAGRGISLRRV
jgi:acyl-CoA thioester hydrolase